ncbi:molecular chaperone HtpG [Aureimonas sp. Leaf324]|uniref:molecular chaperone HtpG n=1 Tax=Aureimonas sp. Leaf324 TaxID=1736336 RepID=UPI0006F3A430|nr:molecular chaperone HtpG [Aureimonas sp. Leaf324]KQQ80771.1 heat-shock protein Hsp90 [Aureimonas sp. Leaf324]
MTAETATGETTKSFEADVARLLHLMVHSVYSDKDVFLRELVSNAADACEKLRFEAIANPDILGAGGEPLITLTIDPAARTLTVEDNGIGMSEAEMTEALGTIARSGTRAFMDRMAEEAKGGESRLIGQFGVGFYSAFMVADRVDAVSRRAGGDTAARWSSDGLGTFTVGAADPAEAPPRGTRVTLHVKEDAGTYLEPHVIEQTVRAQSGHVPVPIALKTAPDAEPRRIADGAALWTKPKSEISADDYADAYRTLAGQFDDPALTLHYRAEGLHEYTVLAFVPGSKPFDLFDPERAGRMKLYVRRVFITDETEILPRWLRFVRGLVDSADLPLNVSREMIQESRVLAAIRKGVTSRVLSELGKLAESDPDRYAGVWENFGAVLKEGLYEDEDRRAALLGLARFHTTTGGTAWRSLKDVVADMKEGQAAIYYAVGADAERLKASPQLEGFAARGIEVLLLTDQVDGFWTSMVPEFEGKPLRSVTQGLADLGAVPLKEGSEPAATEAVPEVEGFIAYLKETLGADVSDVRASERLTDSAVCLVANDRGMDRQLERLLASAGRLGGAAAKPILEVNPRHDLVARLARLGAGDAALREDAARLLLDEARVADGEAPSDPRAFAARLGRVLARALG